MRQVSWLYDMCKVVLMRWVLVRRGLFCPLHTHLLAAPKREILALLVKIDKGINQKRKYISLFRSYLQTLNCRYSKWIFILTWNFVKVITNWSHCKMKSLKSDVISNKSQTKYFLYGELLAYQWNKYNTAFDLY